MPTTLGIMKGKVLAILNKQSGYQGVFTTEKLNDAINDCIDWVYANMLFNGQGWNKTIGYITTTPSTAAYNLPTDCAVIDVVRYLVGSTYQVLKYDDQSDDSFAGSGETTGYPTSYRLVGNQIYFNPIPTQVGTNFIQLEYSTFPAEITSDVTTFNATFTRGLENYVKWRSCSILVSQIGEPNPKWEKYENQWYGHLLELASSRVRQVRFMGSFREGY
jgi:hypothetical protein